MRRSLGALALVLALACSGEAESDSQAASNAPDTISSRPDSAVATPRFPGSGALDRARGAADQASARARAQDSLLPR